MKITRLRISNFLGIANLDAAIPESGAIATGSNAVGKTTVLRAIHAALAAQGIGPEAVRHGSDRAEILLDLDAVTVRRAISANGNSLTVTTAEGDRWAKPQTRLTNLLGATLDPLAFYLAAPAERRRILLSAMPVEVTAEDLQRWTGDDWTPKAGAHGLEVLADIRKCYYDKRTEANKEAKLAAQAAQDAAGKAAALARPELDAVIVPADGGEDEMVKKVERQRDDLARKQQAAEEQEKRTVGAREQVAQLRSAAQAREAAIVGPVAQEDRRYQERELEVASQEVARLEEELAAAKERLTTARVALRRVYEVDEAAKKARQAVDDMRRQALQIESALEAVAITPPTAEEIAAVEKDLATVQTTAKLIKAARAAHAAKMEAMGADAYAAELQRQADALDRIVTTLTTDAPAELAKRSQTIPGVAIDGDAITLDGRALDNLSGAEQLRFAVDLAKRASKAKILVVDGLERLDPARMRDFVAYATGGGWQLIGSRVTEGELVLEAIEPSRVTIEVAAAGATP